MDAKHQFLSFILVFLGCGERQYIYILYIIMYVTRYVYSCMHVVTCLYVCICVPQPFEAFTSLSCGRVKECACADTSLT